MTCPKTLAHLRATTVRLLLLGYCLFLSVGCTADASLPATAPTPSSTSAEQPSASAPVEAASTVAADVAPTFTTYFIFDPEWDIERAEFDVAPGVLPSETITDFLQLARLAYGELESSERAFEAEVVLKNTGDSPLTLNVDQHSFSFEDDQGRKAELVYFCCDAADELLSPGQTRPFHMLFRSVPGWEGKELAAELIFFRVRGVEPVVSAAWQIRPLATAN